MSKSARGGSSDEPIKHPVAAGVALVTTTALVAAVIVGLAKGLASLKH